MTWYFCVLTVILCHSVLFTFWTNISNSTMPQKKKNMNSSKIQSKQLTMSGSAAISAMELFTGKSLSEAFILLSTNPNSPHSKNPTERDFTSYEKLRTHLYSISIQNYFSTLWYLHLIGWFIMGQNSFQKNI